MAVQKKSLVSEFKDFVLRGDVVSLAVGVVMALAFAAVITAFVDIVTNVISIAGKHTAFDNLAFNIRGGHFRYGHLISTVISFVITAAAMFFVVVRPYNILLERRKRGQEEGESDDRPCPECLSSIPRAAMRCAYCTAQVPPAA